MPRRLLAVNVVLAGVSVLCIALIVRQLAVVRPAAPPRAKSATASSSQLAPSGDSHLPPQAYNVIATRNLFSPTRSETSGPGLAGNAPALIAKPSLHGVVLREGSPIAYLEDPLTKRIAGYRIGDPIAGGTVQTISADAVVIARPEGPVDVRLRDPSKPRPPAPAAAGQPPVPGQPPSAGQPPAPSPLPTPGVLPPTPRAFVPPPILQPGQPMPPPPVQQPAPGVPTPVPFSRPSPSLGRRLPPVPINPAVPQQSSPQN